MKTIFTLTSAESRRLTAKAVAQMTAELPDWMKKRGSNSDPVNAGEICA